MFKKITGYFRVLDYQHVKLNIHMLMINLAFALLCVAFILQDKTCGAIQCGVLPAAGFSDNTKLSLNTL